MQKNKYKILTMKKLLLGITAITIFISCKNPTAKENTSTEQQTPAIEHIYKPTYTDNFKIGDQKMFYWLNNSTKQFLQKTLIKLESL